MKCNRWCYGWVYKAAAIKPLIQVRGSCSHQERWSNKHKNYKIFIFWFWESMNFPFCNKKLLYLAAFQFLFVKQINFFVVSRIIAERSRASIFWYLDLWSGSQVWISAMANKIYTILLVYICDLRSRLFFIYKWVHSWLKH